MHQLLARKTKIWIIVGLAAAITWAANQLGWPPLGTAALVGFVDFVVLVLLGQTWPIVTWVPWVPRPGWAKTNLSGIWTGTLISNYRDVVDNPLQPIDVEMRVRQSWQEISFTLRSNSMSGPSHTVIPSFDVQNQELIFRYFYTTEPLNAQVASNPPQRIGAAIAKVDLADPNAISINYTNERGTGGDILLTRTRRKRLQRRA